MLEFQKVFNHNIFYVKRPNENSIFYVKRPNENSKIGTIVVIKKRFFTSKEFNKSGDGLTFEEVKEISTFIESL